MKITRVSQLDQSVNTLDLNVTQEQLDRFDVRRETGEYVQTIFPHLSAEDREFILSGITGEQWKKEFGTMDEYLSR